MKNLQTRINRFTEFFANKVPNDIAYETYFKQEGLEEGYLNFLLKTNITRRTYFWANIGGVYADWPKENGTKRQVI